MNSIWHPDHLRIFLIGFMGSGKSYLSRRLAARIGFPYLDLDEEIELQTRQTISEFFEGKGEAAFREKEREVLIQTARFPRLVVACGGGTPCHHQNMEWMNAHGITIFVDVSAEVLYHRLLPERQHRPLIRHTDENNLENFIEAMLAERRPCYEEAHLIIKASTPHLALDEEIANRLLDVIGH